MRFTRVGSVTGVILLLLGLLEVFLKIVYSHSLPAGIAFVLNNPGKTVFHVVLLPLAATILLNRLPFPVIQYLFRRNRRFPVFLLGGLLLAGSYHLVRESYQLFTQGQLMPYEIRGATAQLAGFRQNLGQESASFHRIALPDKAHWQHLQRKKEIYGQQVKAIIGDRNYFTGTTLYTKYAVLLSVLGLTYVVLLFVATFSIIAGKIELEDRALDAFILNIFILSPWLILRTYSEWYFSLGDYRIQEDSSLLILFCLSILLVMHIAFMRKSRGFIRTFSIGLVLMTGTGLLNILLNPGWIPNIINVFANLSPYTLFFLGVLVFASALSIVWNRVKTFAYLHYLTLSSPLATFAEEQPGVEEEHELGKPTKPLLNGLPEPLSREYADRLDQYFRQAKPYLDPELSIKKVADNLNIPLHHLSWVVNEWLGHNFPDYVNHFRIEEAKHKLRDTQNRNLKIENIGYECGFNSKATFNRVFKKYCHVSPSQYQKTSNDRKEDVSSRVD